MIENVPLTRYWPVIFPMTMQHAQILIYVERPHHESYSKNSQYVFIFSVVLFWDVRMKVDIAVTCVRRSGTNSTTLLCQSEIT